MHTQAVVLRETIHRVPMDVVYFGERANWPVVELEMSGRSVRFLLDTGATVLAVSHEFARVHRLPSLGRVPVRLYAGTVDTEVVSLPEMDFAGAVIPAQDAIVLQLLDDANEEFGCRVDGVLGTKLLDHAIVRWSYLEGWAEIRAATNPIEEEGFEYRPLLAARGGYWVMADVNQAGKNSLFLLDTGRTCSVELASGRLTAKSVQNLDELLYRQDDFAQWMGRLSDVSVAGERFIDVPVLFAARENQPRHTSAVIGSGLFRHSELIVDFARNRLGVRKTPGPERKTGGWGLSVRQGPGGLRVVDLAEDGPAIGSGVAVGDLVKTVAGQPAPKSVCAFYGLLSKRSQVEFGLVRDGETRRILVARDTYLPLVHFR